MAENWASRLNPVTRVRERWDGFRAHPVQNLLSMLLGAGASVVGGPAAGMAANRGSRELFGKWNDRAFNQDSSQLLSDTRNNLDRQIWGGTPQMTANPISYGGMSGITSPQRGNYPTPQGPQQSALASLLGLNNYQGNSPGSGLPGITSPLGDDGGFQPIDLDFGQQVDEESPNGYPGITSENTYAPKPLMNTVVAPTNTVANISGGGARDAFAGGGQSSARGGSSNWGNTFQSLGDLGTQGGGLDPQRNQNVGEQRLRQKARAMLEKDPNDARAQDWFARLRENATAGK